MDLDEEVLESFEAGTLFFSDMVVLFQHLVDTDLLWSLSRGKKIYLETAEELIERGYVKLKS
jgi:hypothetical protein